MSNTIFPHSFFLCQVRIPPLLSGLLILLLVCAPVRGEWEFSAGVLQRNGMSVDIESGSYASLESAGPWMTGIALGGDWRTDPYSWPVISAPEDDITAYGDRQFDDGYVMKDSATGNPLSPFGADSTWYWGYQNAGQYAPAAQSLSFTRHVVRQNEGTRQEQAYRSVSDISRDILKNGLSDDSEDLTDWGFNIQSAYTIGISRHFTLNLACGLDMFQPGTFDQTSSSFEMRVTRTDDEFERLQTIHWEQQQAFDEHYTYVDRNNVLPSTSAPYNGTYAGPGAIIPNLPQDRTVAASALVQREEILNEQIQQQSSTQNWLAFNKVDISGDYQLLSLWLGAGIELQALERLRLGFQPHLGVHGLLYDIKREERLFSESGDSSPLLLNQWSDRQDRTDWTLGWGLRLYGKLHITERVFIMAAVSHESLFDDCAVNVGPDQVTFNIDGWQGALQAGVSF